MAPDRLDKRVVKADPAFAAIVKAAGPYEPRPPFGDPFQALVRSIVFQQLAGKAASAIHGRVIALFDGPLVPSAVLEMPEADLRSAGLSGAKTAAILDLALKCSDGTVPLDELTELDDEEIISRLCVVRGIGRWTAEMFLLFELQHQDVWPVDDFAVRKGWSLIHKLKEDITPKQLAPLGDLFQPHRSVAAWYCWRATDTVLQ